MGENWQVRNENELKAIERKSISQIKDLSNPIQLKEKALLFKALGDETRIKIIGMLWTSDMCRCEITTALQAPASTISHHLKQLELGKVVEARKDGKFTIYSLNVDLVAKYLTD